MPKVSVILPNYNHARFLPKRLDSILNQTFSDYELLILDDKSPDDSIAVIEPYLRDPRARFVPNETNSGSPYLQWRKGLSLTSAEYVWIAESDDYADLDFLEVLVAELDRHPSAGIAMCLPNKVDGEGRVLEGYFDSWATRPLRHYGASPFEAGTLFMNGRDYAARYMTPWNTIPNASGALLRRSTLDAVGGPVTDMKICGDWFTYCKMLMQADFVAVPRKLSYFRTHTTNVRQRTKATDFIRESRDVRAYLERELGKGPRRQVRSQADNFYAQMLLSAERQGQNRKVPLHRYPALFAHAAEFGAKFTLRLAGLLAREAAGRLRNGRRSAA